MQHSSNHLTIIKMNLRKIILTVSVALTAATMLSAQEQRPLAYPALVESSSRHADRDDLPAAPVSNRVSFKIDTAPRFDIFITMELRSGGLQPQQSE